MSVQSGIRKVIQATWIDSGLTPQAKVYDYSTGAKVLKASLAMVEEETGIYATSFIPLPGVSYFVTKRVFTDGTFTVPDVNYAPSSEDFDAVDFQSLGAEVGVILDVSETDEGILNGEDC